VINDFEMGFRFSLNESIVEIAILELGNNSYSIYDFSQIYNLKFVFRKIILGFEILMVKYMVYIL
jgi:hypothetical protein